MNIFEPKLRIDVVDSKLPQWEQNYINLVADCHTFVVDLEKVYSNVEEMWSCRIFDR